MAKYRVADQLGSFRVGDTPGALAKKVSVEIETTDGSPVSLSGVTSVTATVLAPSGGTASIPATIQGDKINLDLSGAFDEAGVWYLLLALVSGAGSIEVEPAPAPVEPETPDGWHTIETARAEWRDAPALDVQLFTLLAVSRSQCIEYGPALVDADGNAIPVPGTWRQAQLMQSRNIWNASKVNPSTGGIGSEEFTYTPYPMDQTIRYILRPMRAIGAIA